MMEKPVKETRRRRYRYQTWPGRLMFALCCVCAAVCACCWLFGMVGHQAIAGFIFRTGVPESQPALSYRDGVPPGKLTDIAVNDESLFLLYKASAVVRAFSHDGEYQYAVIFPKASNRSAELYANGTDMYYRGVSGSGLYHLQGGASIAKYKVNEDGYKTMVAQLRESEPEYQADVCRYGDVQYRIDGQDVLRIQPDGSEEKLIDGPEFPGLLESFPVWAGMMLFGALAVAGWMASLRIERRCGGKK